MKGKTDSEIMFFIFLSFQKEFSKRKDICKEDILVLSFLEMIKIVERSGFTNRSNIILSTNNNVLVARISKKNGMLNKDPIDLYMNHDLKDGIVISTDKIIPHASNIQPNTLFVFDNITKLIKYLKL